MSNEHNEQVEQEITKAAGLLEMDIEEAKNKYDSIVEVNGLNDEDWKLALSLFRQWFSGTKKYADAPAKASTGSNSLVKQASGFFISLDAARDMAAMQNERIKNEYMRDADNAFAIGRVATVSADDDGYHVTRMHGGEEQTMVVKELPENNFEIESGEWIIPLDNMKAYGERANPNFGKPLPHEQFRMAGIFIGDVEGDTGLYYFSYKGEASKHFNPKTFTSVTMQVIRDQNNTDRLYGFKEGTLESLELTDQQVDNETYRTYLGEVANDNLSQLIDLDRYHANSANLPYAKKFVITDGSVSSVNMTPNTYGTRRVTITDLNSDFDYEGGSWAGTTCWFPSHVEIEFGIGSSIVVVGRTSQGRNDDGTVGDVTLNVSGVLVVENRGSVVEPFEADEEDLDWF
tara:strand:- start:2486 stop:3691 length:1206 start_codon:yes stop_codon:yes gene_type:complete